MDNIPTGAIPAEQFEAADQTPIASASPQQSAPSQQEDTSAVPEGAIPEEQFQPQDDSLLGTAKSGIESFERGISFGASDYARAKVDPLVLPQSMQTTPEDLQADKQAHPIVSEIGQLAGNLAGLAVASPIMPEFAAAGKIGSAVLRGALENGIIQSGDEVSKSLLDPNNPDTSVASAIANIGTASLLGAGFGGVLGAASKGIDAIAETKAAGRVGQFLADLGNRSATLAKDLTPGGAATSEIADLFTKTEKDAASVYGGSGLKRQAIDATVPEMHPGIVAQNEEIANKTTQAIEEMAANPETYPPRFTKALQQAQGEWMKVATDPAASSADVFDATQTLKQKLQSYSKFDKKIDITSDAHDWVQMAKGLQHDLVGKLEDTDVWGKAGKLQKDTNEAFKEYLPALQDFRSNFATKSKTRGYEVNPDKVNSLVNQVGNEKGAIKQTNLGQYVEAAQKYRNRIGQLQETVGLPNSIEPVSMTNTNYLSGKTAMPLGAQAADLLHKGIPGLSNRLAGSITGGAIGYEHGGVGEALGGIAAGAMAPQISKVIGRNITGKLVPAALHVISNGGQHGMYQALDFVNAAHKGAKLIDHSVNTLFQAAGNPIATSDATQGMRDKLKKIIEKGGMNQAAQEMSQPTASPTPPSMPGFASGGVVKPSLRPSMKQDPPQVDGVASNFPVHSFRMNVAKNRISNHLNSQRPISNGSALPYDRPMDDTGKQRSYNRVLDMANSPLSVLNEIKDGSLTADHVHHFKSMFPELHNHLSQKITQRMMEEKAKGDDGYVPPYHTRQAMTLFLGSPVESSLTSQSIIAAQQTYLPKSAPQGNSAGQKQKKPSQAAGSALQKGTKSYQTPQQAAQARQVDER